MPRYRTKAVEVEAERITGNTKMGRTEELGLSWDEYGERSGHRGLFVQVENPGSGDATTYLPVPLGSWILIVEDRAMFPISNEVFLALFEEIP